MQNVMDYKVSTVPSGIECELERISSLDVKHLWQLSVRLSLTCLVVMLSLHSSVQFELIFLLNLSSRRLPPVGDHFVVHQGGRLRES